MAVARSRLLRLQGHSGIRTIVRRCWCDGDGFADRIFCDDCENGFDTCRQRRRNRSSPGGCCAVIRMPSATCSSGIVRACDGWSRCVSTRNWLRAWMHQTSCRKRSSTRPVNSPNLPANGPCRFTPGCTAWPWNAWPMPTGATGDVHPVAFAARKSGRPMVRS